MVALESSSYRRQDLPLQLNSSSPPPSAPPRRATVSSPAPSFTFSNTFESRPHSRTDRYGFDHRYPYRRSTISGHSQGHNVNDAPQLTARADDQMMWSGSASSSPIMSNPVVLQGSSPAPSSSGASPQLAVHPVFEYDPLAFHPNLQSPMTSSFSLCPSPEFPNSIDHPRTMPPPLLPTFHPTVRASTAHSTATTTTANTTPALSPAASSTFAFDATVDPPNNPCSPRHHYQQQQHQQQQHQQQQHQQQQHQQQQHHQQLHQHQHQQHALGREEVDAELIRLRNRVRELEYRNEQLELEQFRYAELVSADSKARVHADLGLGLELVGNGNGGHPHLPYSATISTPATVPTTFSFLNQDLGPPPPDWDARTSARRSRFCTPNRAGNALCAWHDSRRERRAHPPRMAPPNTLNCGCTFAEALFEESLARNGVGAYHPGESVRMDPALRNPLLRLLEQRYGYQDGDFERTPDGGWRPDEDAHAWEQKAANSRSSRRER